ncbi:MAG: nucleotidyl transferase AbiEii/AbiGii toxin family protein [Gemmatimonadetes bacterium]|nr:nucleotidyl transferase AbiEii/AbiGii toxin family protein [Gemmatimonadota bacterium]MCY3677512.1 nucleotidyl transferase AbiEii/AbiGii toxin family protein [Gemmatimonadota bacterium]
MITDAEVRRLAGSERVEPRIVELDYALGWALRGIASHQYLARRLVFKGGTCIRKCYFPAYRFSEDLDFTATQRFNVEKLATALTEAFAETRIDSGIDFRVQEPRLRVIDDEYGRESIRFTVYWRGPHTLRGSPRGLRLDVTWNEVLAFSPRQRVLFHPFSDAAAVEDVRVPCYALEEVMCEKIRAVLGQRIYAVSRDLYDIFSLLDSVDEAGVIAALPTKTDARAVPDNGLARLLGRQHEFRAHWQRDLVGLLPPGAERDFDQVWETVSEYVGRVVDRAACGRSG